VALEDGLKKKNVTPQTLGATPQNIEEKSPTICGVALFFCSPPQAIEFSPLPLKKKTVREKK